MKRIVSVSRRTDIPAFYGKWFINRLRQGWGVNYNPYSHKVSEVSLYPESVAAFVFWSKNFKPFLRYLDEIDTAGYHSFFLFTITGLPRVFEPRVVDKEEAVAAFKKLSRRYSPRHVQWRYDPILLTSITGPEYHVRTFRELCRSLEGYTYRCYTSFVNLYPKVERRLSILSSRGIKLLCGVTETEKKQLVEHLACIAQEHGIEIYSCCNDFLVGDKVKKAHCVDIDLIAKYTGLNRNSYRISPTRKQCGCYQSVDIGMYETCPHACLYCYANTHHSAVRRNYSLHNPTLPTLRANIDISNISRDQSVAGGQGQLFFD